MCPRCYVAKTDEEMLTLGAYHISGLRTDAAFGGRTGRNRAMHIHQYDAKSLARHIKAERILYEKSLANQRKWAIIRAKPAVRSVAVRSSLEILRSC